MLRTSLLLLFTTALLRAETCACTIPVFRYALDRWETDRFQLVVPASTSQNTELTDLLRPLRANGKANLDITTAKDSAVATAELLDSKTGTKSLWKGGLNKAALDAVLDSPGRKQITERILAGESIVWVIVDDGKPESQPEIERIEKRLKFLEQVASLPIQDPNDPDSQLGPGPALLLKFTTLRLRADDPAEKILTTMLAGPEGKIDAAKAFAAPVFGRGRVLGAWNLDQLDDASLEEACMFLVGRCSCRMKNENPGWDILLNVDWPKALEEAKAKKPAVEVAQAVQMKQPETVVTESKDDSPPTDQASPRDSIPQSSILLTSASLLLAGLAALLYRNKR
jgi:hypothetical protein